MCPVCRCPHFLGLPWAGRVTGNPKPLFLMFFPIQSLLFKNGFLLACLCPLVQGIDPKNKLGDLPQFGCKLCQIDRGVLDRPHDLPHDSRQWFFEFCRNTADVPSCTLPSKPSPGSTYQALWDILLWSPLASATQTFCLVVVVVHVSKIPCCWVFSTTYFFFK